MMPELFPLYSVFSLLKELFQILMNRVNCVTAESQDKRPIYTSQLQSGYKAEFAKYLQTAKAN